MKFAVASDDGATVAAHTGRCGGFVIFESKAAGVTRIEFRANRFTAHALGECAGGDAHEHQQGHAGHGHVALVEALQDCPVLITRGLGRRLVADLAARGITPYASDVADVDEAARRFASGVLQPVTQECCGSHGE
jgi:predicted Fe-Mo cluster-binding NifX family protein